MYIEEIKNYKNLKGKKRKNIKVAYDVINKFVKSGFVCARVVDDEFRFNNNGDLRRTLQRVIEVEDMNLKVFMLNGSVYLRRKNG